MAPTNNAAYLDSKKSPGLVVKNAPYTSPKAGQIVIKNHAFAINPLDWSIQERGDIMYGWLKYPFVLGADVAGEVIEIGSNVTRFNIGDRIIGHCAGTKENINESAQSGFQKYVVLLEHMSSGIPEGMSYEVACVVPLGFSTASCGLFQKDQLALPLPTSPKRKPSGETVLIWGGSTSVGVNAIQLAVAAGYEVITTCSPRNYDLVKRLGASHAYDYNSPTVIADITHLYKSSNKTSAGAISIGQGSALKCIEILKSVKGSKFVSMASYPVAAELPKYFALLFQIYKFLSGSIHIWFKSSIGGVKTGFIFGDTLIDNGIGKAVYEGYLEKALREGAFRPSPEPVIFGRGLDAVQGAMNKQKLGVSAKKIVVLLP